MNIDSFKGIIDEEALKVFKQSSSINNFSCPSHRIIYEKEELNLKGDFEFNKLFIEIEEN